MTNAATPNVNSLAQHEFDWIVERATYFKVAEDAEGLAGFVLCVPSGLDYWSNNYKWFTARFNEFLYLDRVVVAARTRGQGVGTRLYDDLHATVKGKWPRVTLEVNLQPPNPGSVRFHERLGYVPVGVREYDEGRSVVQMYERQM
jgi:predicted GNAT superfamily acetyltransferase